LYNVSAGVLANVSDALDVVVPYPLVLPNACRAFTNAQLEIEQ
jgi:hypothetical protein